MAVDWCQMGFETCGAAGSSASASTAAAAVRLADDRGQTADELEGVARSTSRSSSSSLPSSQPRSTAETSSATIFGCTVGFQVSPSANSSSWIFSPGRAPMKVIRCRGPAPCRRGGSCSAPGRRSGSARPCRARGLARAADRARLDHERTASGIVMKKRVISASVTVTGPPALDLRRKSGITLPAELRTLPKRTATNFVGTSSRCAV